MSSKDSLGDRMKSYEAITDYRLIPKLPLILRLDGRAFHTLTRGMTKPVDWKFVFCMKEAAIALCEEIDCVKLAYTYSDEISLLLVDYVNYRTQPWFDYRLQKVCSSAASLATLAFFKKFACSFPDLAKKCNPTFDCRAFTLPLHEVANYFIWRQQDATRTSIAALAQAHFSHKRLHGKNSSDMQDMLVCEKGINWNDCSVYQKRGSAIIKREKVADGANMQFYYDEWGADPKTPIFSKDREYIEKYVYTVGDKDPK